jgi:hypothetical protein
MKSSVVKTEFKYVYRVLLASQGRKQREWFRYAIHKKGQRIMASKFETPKEAAIALDKKLIELGFEPVNILKKKAA